MERSTKPGKTTGKKETGESKIPKSTNCASAKETSSKVSAEKETAPNLKNTAEATISAKLENEQSTNLQKCVKRMSVVKISKDVENQLQTENLMSDDNVAGPSASTKVQEKEKIIKQLPSKEKTSQATEKKSGRLPMKPSGQDPKPCAAFGGMRFIGKKKPFQKLETFQKVTKELKERKEMSPTEPCTKELKRTVSASAVVSKGSYKKLDNAPSNKAESSKATSLPAKEATLKKFRPFGGMRFAPKWQSTPLKPDLINAQKASKEELNTPVSSSERLQQISNIENEKNDTITIDETITFDETLQPPNKNRSYKAASPNMEAFDMSSIFAGLRMTPKRKSTHPKPDIFKGMNEELKTNDQESRTPDACTEQKKKSPASAKATLNTETKGSHVGKSELSSTQKISQKTAFGGMRFEPKWQSTPIRPDIFDKKQKEPKGDCLESQPTDSSTKLLRTVSASAIGKIKADTKNRNVELLATQKPESSKINPTKNTKKVIAGTHGGLRFKPQQKNRRA